MYASCADYVRYVDAALASQSPRRTLDAMVRLELEVTHLAKHARPLRKVLRATVNAFSKKFGRGLPSDESVPSRDRVAGIMRYLDDKLVPNLLLDLRRAGARRKRTRARRG
jgi:hypothetical protein